MTSKTLYGYISNEPETYLDSKGRLNFVGAKDNRSLFDKIKQGIEQFGINAERRINRPTEDETKQDTSTILALTTAPFGLGAKATGAIAKPLVKYTGNKIANMTAQGIGGGLVGGGIEGVGYGLANDENPILTGLSGAGIGAVTGALGGLGIGKIGKRFDERALNKGTLNTRKFFDDYLIGTDKGNVGIQYDSLNPKHLEQLKIIENTNPAPNDYQTWIRSVDDIYDFEDTLKQSDWADYWQDGINEDYSGDMIKQALNDKQIKVYSSHPIATGEFVSPSKIEALSYSGNGKVYEKVVPLDDVAWIDPTQGQYAPPKLSSLYDNIVGEPLKYTGDYVRLKGVEYPEVFLPMDEYAPKFSDINTYVYQNNLQNYRDIIERYFPEYNLEVIMDKGIPRIVQKRNN